MELLLVGLGTGQRLLDDIRRFAPAGLDIGGDLKGVERLDLHDSASAGS